MEKGTWKVWLVAVGIILLLIIGVWFGKPIYRHFEEQRSQAAAQKFLARHDYRNAFLSARQTLAVDATNVVACRVMAELANLSHSPATLDWWQKIVKIDPSFSNQLALASVSLNYEQPPFPLAEKILRAAPASATNLVAFQNVAAQFALRTRNLGAAAAHFAEAVRLEPTNKVYQLNLAVINLSSRDPTVVETARKTLEKLESDEALRAAALRSLIAERMEHEDFSAALNESTQLLAGAEATTADHLQFLEILRRLQSPQLHQKLNSFQSRSATNAPAVAEIAGWMNGNGFSTNAVDWLTHLPPPMQTQTPVRLALVNCYLTETNWLALRNLVATSKWGDLDYLRLAFLSRAWSGLGQNMIAESDWRAAVGESENRPAALNALLGLANQWQMKSAREELLKRIVTRFPQNNEAKQALEQIYLNAGDTRKLNDLYAKLLKDSSNNVLVKNNFAATSLLLRTNLPEAFSLAQTDAAQNPQNPFFVSTYAYSLYLQGQMTNGLVAMEKLKPESLNQPSVALYYGILLAANGKTNQAETYFKIARTQKNLLPEEKKLLPAETNPQ